MSSESCPYFTDGRHRHAARDGLGGECVCGDKTVSLFDQVDAPARDHDPYSSKQAAQKVRRKAGTQARRALEVIAQAGPAGASTREIQKALYDPADSAWNKVATRCKALEDRGLVRRHDRTRDEDGQHFLVYEITAAGTQIVTDEA